MAVSNPGMLKSTVAVLRATWALSRARTVLLGTWVLWDAIRPVLQALLVARLVDTLTRFLAHGAAAPPQRELIFWVVATGLMLLSRYFLSHFADAFLHGLAWDLDRQVGMRLLRAVARPTGIAHLEDPEVADDIALARGAILGASAGRSIRILGRNAGARLSALATGIALLQFRWWAPLLVMAAMLVTRLWAQRDMLSFMKGFEMATPILRRAAYFRDLLLSPDAAKEVRVFGIAEFAVERFRNGWQHALSEIVRHTAPNRWVLGAAVIMQGVAFGCVAVGIAVAGARGALTPGQVALYLQVAVAMLAAVMNIDADYEFGRAAVSFNRVADLDRRLVVAERRPARPAMDLPQTEIRFERVSFRYPNQEQAVFQDLDLVIPAGRSLAIVGANGAGKTTLVKLLSMLYQPDAGRILVDGIDSSRLDPVAWRQRMAVLFQDFCRWALPVRDNVAFGAPAVLSDETLRAVLNRAGAETIVEGLPLGLDTPLSRRFRGGTDLSGGQWQRIALARALAAVERGARVLILDEPTASLDVRAEAEFYERFLDLTKGLTTIVISHRFATVRLADEIVVVEGGRVIERGTHDELLELGGSYARMFRLQAERFLDPTTAAEGLEAMHNA